MFQTIFKRCLLAQKSKLLTAPHPARIRLIHVTPVFKHGEYEWQDPKSEDEVVNIVYITKDGKKHPVKGKVGDNVLYLAHRYGIEMEEPGMPQPTAGTSDSGPSGTESERSTEWVCASKHRRMKQKLRRQRREEEAERSGSTAPAPSNSGEPRPEKVKRRTTDPEEQRPAKRPNRGSDGPRGAAREQSDLAVMIRREDGATLDEAAAGHIRKVLREQMTAAILSGMGGPALAFATSGLVAEGFYLVTPMTEEARGWLLSLDLGTYQGVSLTVKKLEKSRVVVWLQGREEERWDDPWPFIVAQNRHRGELRIDEWTLMHREAMPLGERLVLAVPEDVVAEPVWLDYQFTQAQAKRLHQNAHVAEPNKTTRKMADTARPGTSSTTDNTKNPQAAEADTARPGTSMPHTNTTQHKLAKVDTARSGTPSLVKHLHAERRRPPLRGSGSGRRGNPKATTRPSRRPDQTGAGRAAPNYTTNTPTQPCSSRPAHGEGDPPAGTKPRPEQE